MAQTAESVASAIIFLVQIGWFVLAYCRFMDKHQKPKAKVMTLFNGEK